MGITDTKIVKVENEKQPVAVQRITKSVHSIGVRTLLGHFLDV